MPKTRVVLKEGLISENAADYALLANRCQNCEKIYFPQRDFCLECGSGKLETIKLSNCGTLYTYTIVNMPSEHYAPPYAIGWVEFPEGVRVFGQIKGFENTNMQIGMSMKVVIDTLWQEQDKEIIAYKFVPALTQNSMKQGENICGK